MILFLLNCIALLIPAGLIAQKCVPRNPLKALLLTFILFLCSLTAIELGLGGFSILNNLTLSISALGVGLVGILVAISAIPPDDPTDLKASPARLNKRGIIFLALIITILSIPVQSVWIEYLFQVHRIHPLISWDVVTYHLPNAIDYLQTSSLWTMRGSFSQYPGGNELINIWSFLPLKTDAFLGMNSLAFNSIISLALMLLLRTIHVFKSQILYWISFGIIWIIFFIQPDYQIAIFAFGQNDLSLAMVEILALWMLIQALEKPQFYLYWSLLGSLLGIGIGIKPNGLYYFLGFIFLIFYSLKRDYLLPLPKSSAQLKTLIGFLIKILTCITVPAAAFAGFWYLRNFVVFGQVFQDGILKLFSGAIIYNLFNPQLYGLYETNIIVLVILGINLVGLGVLIFSKFLQKTPFSLLLIFNGIAFFSFIITPQSAGFWAGNTWVFKTQLRYGITLVPITIIVAIISLVTLLKWIIPAPIHSQGQRFLSSLHPTRASHSELNVQSNAQKSFQGNRLSTITQVCLGILALCLVQGITYHPPEGLPNFDAVLFRRYPNSPASQVYIWVQQNITHKTIYTIGLRPYGLYNMPFSNRVIYGGDSDEWTYDNALKVLETEKPDFLALSRNPFNGKFPLAVTEILNHPRQFEIMYGDALAMVFKVHW